MLSTGSQNKLKLVFDVPSPNAASYYEYTVRDASNQVCGLLLLQRWAGQYLEMKLSSQSEPITLLLHSYSQMIVP